MINRLYYCYGCYDGTSDCESCEVAPWCKEAKDEKPCGREHVYVDNMVSVCSGDSPDYAEVYNRMFSYDDMRCLLRYLVTMPPSELKALYALVNDRDLDRQMYLAAVARACNVSRQAIHQTVSRAIQRDPKLSKVFLYRKSKEKAKRLKK